MGKYIIELERGETAYKTVDSNGTPLIQLLAPIPYTEPDLEQVRKEAYKDGYNSACKVTDVESKTNTAYQKGLSDAWEAARKLLFNKSSGGIGFNAKTIKEVFGVSDDFEVLRDYSPAEVVDKIRQYEQEKRFCVGDEFENETGKRFVILKMDGTEIERYMDWEGKTYCMIVKYKVIRKTGRHFPEIAEVLRKMKETDNG